MKQSHNAPWLWRIGISEPLMITAMVPAWPASLSPHLTVVKEWLR
jgi:hypothetical protein